MNERPRRLYYVPKILTPEIISSICLLIFLCFVMKDGVAEVNAECEELFSSEGGKEGSFSTPAWPNRYPPDTRCRFKFRGAETEVVWISWNEFHLEGAMPNKQCLRDYVEVIVIDYHNQHHVNGRYCGENKPPDFHTMQRSVDIIFQSSFTKHYKGFSGTYTFISEKDVQPPVSIYPGVSNPSSKNCGGFAAGRHGGIITNPGYPETYPAGVDCSWVIRVRPGKQIYINLLELELTESIADCQNAKVEVIDGYAHVPPGSRATQSLSREEFIEFCGQEDYLKQEGQKSYMSEKNRMIVRFTTSKKPGPSILGKRAKFGKPVGFRLVWTEVSVAENVEECVDFYCGGGRYCIEQGQNVCISRKRYCIDKSLVCDGMPNCAESDNSDEENCYSYEILGAGASVFCFLVLVILLVICCQRRRNRKQLIRMHRDRDTSTLNSTVPVGNSLPDGRSGQKTAANRRREYSGSGGCGEVRELKALPMNYHGYKDEEEAGSDSQPFLLPNHLPSNQEPTANLSFPRLLAPHSAEDTPDTDTAILHKRIPVCSEQREMEDVWQYRAGPKDHTHFVEFHKDPKEPLFPQPLPRQRPPPPVPLKPILKSGGGGYALSVNPGQNQSGRPVPVPPPRVDSARTIVEAEYMSKCGKSVGFAPVLPAHFQTTPIPPPTRMEQSVQNSDRSSSPWHHRTKPTEV